MEVERRDGIVSGQHDESLQEEKASEKASMPPPSARPLPKDPSSSAPSLSKTDMPPPPLPKPLPKEVRVAAAQAAAAAAAHAAPAQRERIIAQAAAAAIAQATKAQEAAAAAGGSRSGGAQEDAGSSGGGATATASATYEPPEWGGPPDVGSGSGFSLEVLKSGTIVETRQLGDKGHYVFGRNPACEFVLEHPSASRLHAVLQFKAGTSQAFLYDNASTHGTFVNKQKAKPKVFIPLRVGDTLRFGTSSRLYVVGGPEELRPEEGLTASAKAKLAALEHLAQMKEKDKQMSRAAMEAALSAGDVTWGMGGEDAVDDSGSDVDVDWRSMAANGKLTEKQQKLADKIKQKEYKMKNLQTEIDRIMAKERNEGGLTSGQASTLARNEQALVQLREEVEEIEEMLSESVRDAIADRNKEKSKAAAEKARRRKRGTTESDEEYLLGGASDSEDEFYDRTAAGGMRKKAKKAGAGGQGKGSSAKEPAVAQVESAESLYGKREVLTERKQQLLSEIAAEEKLLAAADSEAEGAGLSGSEAQGQGQPEAATGDVDDSLDAFMSTMHKKLEGDKLKSLRQELSEVEAGLARVEKLLKIADPDGYLRPGTKAAAAAKAAAAKTLETERKRREAAAAAAAKRKAEEEAAAAAGGVVEEEEEDEQGGGGQLLRQLGGSQGPQQQQKQGGKQASGNIYRLEADDMGAGGLQLRHKPGSNPAAAAAAAAIAAEFGASRGGTQVERAAEVAGQGQGQGGGTAPGPEGGAGGGGGGLLSGLTAQLRARGRGGGRPLPQSGRPGAQSLGGGASVAAAEQAVEADLTALSAAERRRQELQELERQEAEEAAAAAALAAKHAAQRQQEELRAKLGY